MELYVPGYHNAFVRMLYSVFVSVPVAVWLNTVARLIPCNQPFVNYTNQTDVQLQQIWLAAQNNLATNSIPYVSNSTPNSKAMTVQPSAVAVIPVPDWPVSDFMKYDLAWTAADKNPSGTFGYLEGFNYFNVHAVTMCWARPRIYAAASEIPTVLQYEMENIILHKLGYNTDAR